MTFRPRSQIRAMCFALAFAALACAAAHPPQAAELERDAQREIAHLLDYLGTSKCAFYRNGTWHDAQQARVHLDEKYRYLQRWTEVRSAEDFLARAATSSSTSGVPYQVRCNGQAPVESARWLRAELQRYRSGRAGAVK